MQAHFVLTASVMEDIVWDVCYSAATDLLCQQLQTI